MKKAFALIYAVFFTTIAAAQQYLAVGQAAPNFKGKNQNGEIISLKNTLKKGKVVVVFYRGYWCPNCSRAVKSLQDSLQLLTDKNVSVIAVTPEGADGVSKTVRKSKATFSVISDKGLKISTSYKVAFKITPEMDAVHKKYNIDVAGNNGENGDYLVRPAVFIIDKNGKIVYRNINTDAYSNPNSNNRATVKELLENL